MCFDIVLLCCVIRLYSANVSLQGGDNINISTKYSDENTLLWTADNDDVWNKGYTIALRDQYDNVLQQQTI